MTQSGRALKKLLIISAVLNVFLAGAIVGGTYRYMTRSAVSAATQQRALRFAASELSEARRASFATAIQQSRHESQPLIDGGRAGRLDVIRTLSAPQFDPAALNEALARTRTADAALRARLEQTVADFAGNLSFPERLKLVDAMKRGSLRVAPPSPKQ
jgi:uncharacterized membrane protein